MAGWRAERVELGFQLGPFKLGGTWVPDEKEREAAWELYVELVTRVSVVPLAADEGLAREALSSLYSMFAVVREILRRYGPVVAEPGKDSSYSFGQLAVWVLNFELRPLLARWHPALDDWESSRPEGRSLRDHEAAWGEIDQLRAAVEGTRLRLVAYADALAAAAGVPSLTVAPDA